MRIICKNCYSKNVIKKGERKKIFENIQLYWCKDCRKYFTLQKISNKTYPIRVIMHAISIYNLGNPLDKTAKLVNKRYKVKIKPSTIHSWIKEFEKICTYRRIREKTLKNYNPNEIIFEKQFIHKQPYNFRYHKAKLNMFINNYFKNIKDYIINIAENCPNELFEQENYRSSELKFSDVNIKIFKKDNDALKLTELALHCAKNNKERHNALQDFMLINDSATIACEVPVYLLKDEISKFKLFNEINLNYLTGHVDIIQSKFGKIYLLDYKPDASKENKQKVISQLFSYALALSLRTNVWLRNFRCAWFDQDNYFEFNPNEIIFKTESLDDNEKKKYFSNLSRDRYYTSKEFYVSRNKEQGALL